MRTIAAGIFSAFLISLAFSEQNAQTAPPAQPAVQKPAAAKPAAEKAVGGAPQVETSKNSLGLTVARALIAKGIDEDNRPVEPGTEFKSDVKRLYCITQIQGAKDPVKIEHRWYRDETLITTIELPVKSLNWRTQSYKTILPDMTGKWKVAVLLMPQEELLTTLNFAVQ